MIIEIKVKTKSDKNLIGIDENGNYFAHLTCLPIKGKANNNLIELLSEYSDVAKSRISIIKGLKSKNKIVEIK